MTIEDSTRRTERQCSHCGHVGEDVHYWTEYVGGQGNVSQLQCDNKVLCWARWDRDNMTEEKDAKPAGTPGLV
ncbi:hypothetical protein LCGC14_1848940 [marine sediment metagenome]|uniref:Uncharacterized protein n=1 Tax=marine sediment metagenome TaxID=412755 RepID=A0A0F9GAV1_9ZZZZ